MQESQLMMRSELVRFLRAKTKGVPEKTMLGIAECGHC
jgi:hypothetical protein